MKLYICTGKQMQFAVANPFTRLLPSGTCLCEKDYGLKTFKMNHGKYLLVSKLP